MTLQNSGLTAKEGATYWMTGLSGAGKSTLAEAMKAHLDIALGDKTKVFVLDGDIIRQGLNKGLGFSPEDRKENIRRITEVAKLMNSAGQIVFVAFIAPAAGAREAARKAHEDAGLRFVECYISASLEACEARDVKGMYAKARAGTLPNFTGISAPYDAPKNADLIIDTGAKSLDQCMIAMQRHMVNSGIISDGSQASRVVPTLITKPTEAEYAAMENMPALNIDTMQLEFLQTIGDGWAYPLKRFMNEMELLEVMNKKTLTVDGVAHLLSVPITQHVTKEQKESFAGAKSIKITNGNQVYAVIDNPVFFDNRKEEICARTFGCMDTRHPMGENIMNQGDFLVSGDMRFTKRVQWHDKMDQYRMTPAEIAHEAYLRNADAVFAFQVRNPLHNGHCLLLKQTREDLLKQGYKNPVLLLHPLGGWCKDDDVPLGPRMEQHQALINDGTLPKEHIILAVWPSPMFYGGPTEVMWHCSSRIGCGITHFITGRDPAGCKHPDGTKDLYDAWHGQKLLKHNQSMLKGIEVLPFKVAALNMETEQMEFFRPAEKEKFKFVSGSEMRRLAAAGETPPKGFMSPDGWEVLKAYYQSLSAAPTKSIIEQKVTQAVADANAEDGACASCNIF